MKKCVACGCLKEIHNFSLYSNRGKLIHRNSCKECRSKYQQSYYKQNKDKIRSKYKIPEEVAKQQKYKAENKDKVLLYKKRWRDKNKGKQVAYLQTRRSAKSKRTPKWLTEEHLASIHREYELAAWCTKVTGIKYHVDHIVPLRGKTVSGLHVPWNLQVIPATDNLAKGNKFEQS